MKNKIFDTAKLTEALSLLEERLRLADAPAIELVVCGGSALIATGLVPRTTCDIDIVALLEAGELKDSEPLPDYLVTAARSVGHTLGLPSDWLNNGPAAQYRMGLPEGFRRRLQTEKIGEKLIMHYIGRRDQIFFKTYAAADRGGYHVADLRALEPTSDELVDAARWCMTQDVSAEFRQILKSMFEQTGWADVSKRI